MDNLASTHTTELLRKRKHRKQWKRAVAFLSAVTLVGTTWALTFPAHTLEAETFCGLEEHPEHEDACYALRKVCPYGEETDEPGNRVLICESEETASVEPEAAFELTETVSAEPELICGRDESAPAEPELICGMQELAHEHTEDCFILSEKCVCGMEAHTHDENCMDENGELLCELTEHIHDESCYEQEKILVCELINHIHDDSCWSEPDEGHIHTAECYSLPAESEEPIAEPVAAAEAQTPVSETAPEAENGEVSVGHIHTESCYHVHTEDCFERVLLCEIPLHEHTKQCYSDPSLTESASHWEESMKDVELTGVWADDVIAIARTQLGYSESTKNYLVNEDDSINGYTRYGAWYGNPFGDWCAMFVSFCLNYAKIGSEYVPYAQGCTAWVNDLSARGMFVPAGSYIPQKGDIIFFDYADDGLMQHVGLVAEVSEEENTLKTIEGNNIASVEYHEYSIDDPTIGGYGVLPENPDPLPAEAENEEAETLETIEAVTDDGVTVTVTGALPEGAAVQLAAVPEDVLAEILEKIGTETPVFAYDITIVDSEGNVWQPDELGAKVSVSGLTVPAEGTMEVAHVPEDGEIEVVDSTATDDGVEFTAPSFSIYIGYTVDFSYAGLTFSIPGEGSILLSELFSQLGIPRKASEVKFVRFTNDELIGIEKTENDWKLTSLLPFDTLEILTIGFSEEESFDIEVRDARSDEVPATGSSSVNVSVNWTGAPVSGDIIAILYKDGTATDQTLTLNSTNNWSGAFTGLGSGNYSIEYTTTDIGIELTACTGSGESAYRHVTEPSPDNVYVLVHDSDRSIQMNSSNALTRGSVTVSGDTVSDVSDAECWYYDGSSWKNQSSTNRYLNISRNAASTSTTASTISYTSGRYLIRNRYYLTNSDNSYGSSTSTNSAKVITLYEHQTDLSFNIFAKQREDVPFVPTTPSSFEHKKTIDSFADRTGNPDTDLDDKLYTGTSEGNPQDYYRLYLDMTGKQEPIDLLIVVDGSGSMREQKDIDGMRRDYAVTQFLNGSRNGSVTDEGFIKQFLDINPDNQVSVVQFYGIWDEIGGNTSANDSHRVSSNSFSYTQDSTVLLDWTNTVSYVDCEAKASNGTNYEAGLKRANVQFHNSNIANNGHKKMMIFMSDGVPTFFMIDQNDIGTRVYNYTLTSGDVGHRYGRGRSTEYDYIKEPSKVAFDDFRAQNQDVLVFSIGVSNDINASSTNTSQSPDVLKYMCGNDNSRYLAVTSSMDQLTMQLRSIFYPKGVTITDNLSKYVRLADDADVRVTMKDRDTGVETVLYADGASRNVRSEDGTPIFDRIVFTPGNTDAAPDSSTGTIQAIFGSGYEFRPEYTYTLSFNVKNTQTAYDEFAESGYNATGDLCTDYGTNTTSSNKPGFRSNDSATVSYSVTDGALSESYVHPVVQVNEVIYHGLTIRKTVNGASTTAAFPFELTVTDASGAPEDMSSAQLPSGASLKTGTTNVICFSLSSNQTIEFGRIFPEGSRITLGETEHSGYTVTMKIGSETYGGDTRGFDINSDTEVNVYNSVGAELPETGGAGTSMFTFGGLLLMAGTCVYGFMLRNARRRRNG